MKLLELFSGTKSASKVLIQLYPDLESVSLDFCPKYQPDILIDILEWDYTFYPRNYFDIVWASPNCKEYSRAKTVGVRDFEYADRMVKKTLEIIKYFNPTYWFLENPWTGLLKTREFMKELPMYRVDYCRYGHDSLKPTAIWSNIKDFEPKICKKQCGMIVEINDNGKVRNIHKGCMAGQWKILVREQHNYSPRYVYEDRIKVPEKLLCEIFANIQNKF